MKLDARTLMVSMMMVGSLAAVGCSKASSDASGDAVAPEETVAEAPVASSDSASPGVEQDSRGFHYYAPRRPPAARFEERGRAPSERHFWAPGYHRWNGREHVWYNGRWEQRREGYEYVSPRWQESRGRWEYLPGRWVRR
jgi:hypothetical protein